MIIETFGELIKYKRTNKGNSLRYVAETLDISLTYLADIENGRSPSPSENILKLMLNFYEIDTKKEEYFFLDLAAKTRRKDIPLDVKEYLIEKPILLEFIRKLKDDNFISIDYVNKIMAEAKI